MQGITAEYVRFKTGRTNKLLFPAENPTSAVNKDAVCFFVPSGKHWFFGF